MSEKVLSVLKENVIRIWRLIKFAGCLCLILATFYHGYNYLNKVFKNPDVYYGEGFHNMPEDSVDILVLGSSHAQYSFIPMYVYQNTGLYSYVLGSACQPLRVSYEMLKEALKTQSPELVVLEAFTATPLKSSCDGDSCYVTAEYQMTGQEKLNTINFLPEEKAKTYINDFLNYHNNWKTMESFEDFKYKENKELDYAFGYVYAGAPLPASNFWYQPHFNEMPEVELDSTDLQAFNNIYNLCQENGIQLLLYMMPMDSLDEINQAYRYKIWDWADEHEVKYLDFVDMAEKLDYRMQIHNDGFHSYSNGSSFITDYISDYIVDNYDIKNHKDNEFLNKAYKKLSSAYTIGVLNTEFNPKKYMRRFVNYPGTIVMRYSGNQDMDSTTEKYLYDMGVSEDFNKYGCYLAIFKNDELITHSDSEFECDIDGHHFLVNKDCIIYDDEIIDNVGGFSFAVFENTYNTNIVKRISFVPNTWDYGYDTDYNQAY